MYCTGISNLPLLSSEMRSMFIHLGPQGPVVFLLMSAECGKRIRNILGLMEHCSGYYDPESDGNDLLTMFSSVECMCSRSYSMTVMSILRSTEGKVNGSAVTIIVVTIFIATFQNYRIVFLSRYFLCVRNDIFAQYLRYANMIDSPPVYSSFSFNHASITCRERRDA